MSRSRRASKAGGFDFWSRRSGCGCLSFGPVAKWITKMKMKTRKRRLLAQAAVDPEAVEGRFGGE